MTEREKYWLWLCSAETIGQASMDKLLKSFGDIEAVFKCDRRTLDKFEWLDEKQKEDLCKYKSRAGLDELSKTLSKKGISFISCENKAYPKKSKHIFEYPRGLFYMGTPPWDFDGNLKAASKLRWQLSAHGSVRFGAVSRQGNLQRSFPNMVCTL